MAEDTAQRISEKTTPRFLGRENQPIVDHKLIGQGVFSRIFSGHYEGEARDSVAIKVAGYDVTGGDERIREVFDLENNVLRLLEKNGSKHTPIVHNYHEGALPFDRPYIVMDLAQGKSLSDFTYVGTEHDEKTALEIAYQLAETLEAAHRAGYAYADWKFPGLGNFFWDPDRRHLTVIDWNVARELTEKERLMNVRNVSRTLMQLLNLDVVNRIALSDKNKPKWSKLSSSAKDILIKGMEAEDTETYTDLATLKTDLTHALESLTTN